MSDYSARVIADSIWDGTRITTLEVTIPRFVLAEFNTHRVFARNSASSRAIPVHKRILSISESPFVPEMFASNKKGMQAGDGLPEEQQREARRVWIESRDFALVQAQRLAELGAHKQWANRLLEPFAWHTLLVTSTEWANFFALRDSTEAQPEFAITARLMREAMDSSRPRSTSKHLPLVYPEDYKAASEIIDSSDPESVGAKNVSELLIKVSVGRCARVSYLTHDGIRDLMADVRLCHRLLENGHMSPFEHVAFTSHRDENTGIPSIPFSPRWRRSDAEIDEGWELDGYFCGTLRFPWLQYRKTLTNEDVFRKTV